jgi:arylsulfatase B
MDMNTDRRSFLKGCGFVVAGLTGIGCAEARKMSKGAAKPNVVVIMTDDQGMGDIGCMGNPYVKTPNVDKLWADSVRLTDYHVCPTCSPTRAGFLTGMYTNRVGAWWTIRAREIVYRDEMMMSEVFKNSGYATAMFGKWHLGENYPFRPQDRGYDHVVIHGGGAISQSPDWWGNDYFDDMYWVNGEPTKFEGYCTDVWFEEATKFISKSSGKPFFAHIATNIAHVPMIPPEGYEQKYLDMGIEGWMAKYYSMLENMDENVGRLIGFLEKEGLLDNTVFMFTTDNGSSGFKRVTDGQTPIKDPAEMREKLNGGLRGYKGDSYDGGHRVPMFIKWPDGGLTGGKDIDSLCGHIDILPTMMDICGLSAPAKVDFDGRNMGSILRGKKQDWDDDRVLVNDSQRVESPVKYRRGMVMTRKWRLVYSDEAGTPPELFSTDDRAQQNDVADKHPGLVKELIAAYDAWWDELQPAMKKVARIVVGNDAENPSRISSHDMMGGKGSITHSAVNSNGDGNGGFYSLEADVAGKYVFDLMRWPPEAMGPINGEPKWLLGKGKPKLISVNKASLKIDGREYTKAIGEKDEFASFKLKLGKGPFKLENMFYDGDKPVVGASYIRVTRR